MPRHGTSSSTFDGQISSSTETFQVCERREVEKRGRTETRRKRTTWFRHTHQDAAENILKNIRQYIYSLWTRLCSQLCLFEWLWPRLLSHPSGSVFWHRSLVRRFADGEVTTDSTFQHSSYTSRPSFPLNNNLFSRLPPLSHSVLSLTQKAVFPDCFRSSVPSSFSFNNCHFSSDNVLSWRQTLFQHHSSSIHRDFTIPQQATSHVGQHWLPIEPVNC